jgi:AcrR family transcriptional regulator
MVDVLSEETEVAKASCKGRGRPRSEDVDHLILEAVLDVVAEVGITSVSMEGIAARAGVSKASIYRRFDSKDKLTVAAVEYMREQSPEIPTSGTAFERLHGLLDGLRASLPSSRYGRIMVNVLAASNENPSEFSFRVGRGSASSSKKASIRGSFHRISILMWPCQFS